MQISEVPAFDQILDTAAVIFGKKLNEDVKRAYFEALKTVPLATIRQCAQTHIANGKFFPKPVDLKPKYERAKEDGDSKFPPLYSPEWWEGRVQVLRQTAPQGMTQPYRDNLDLATFGKDDCPELRAQARAAYAKAWPWMQSDEAEWGA